MTSRLLVRIAVLMVAVVAAALSVSAQPAPKTYRIGTLGNENTPPWEAFRQGLRDLGYIEGRNVTLESRWSGGTPERLAPLAIELAKLKVDVIVASSTQAVRAAMQATSTIPIVIAVSSYPEKIGLVQSIAHPGGNVTGLTNISPELSGKRLQLLKEIASSVTRLMVVWNPTSPVEPFGYRDVLAAASTLGIEVQSVEVRTPDDFAATLARLSPPRGSALLAFGNPVNFRGRQQIADFALKHRLPSIYEERLFVEAGGLISYAPSFSDLFRRAAGYVDRILKGTKPADLPVEQPQKFELVVNMKTAKLLGVTIPPSVLIQADTMIE